jgi:uroporphyrinogen-III synthase
VEGADCIVIASPAAAEALTAAAGRPSTPLVAIGPTTAAAARALGWNALAAAHPTVADVAAAVRVALASPDRSGSR